MNESAMTNKLRAVLLLVIRTACPVMAHNVTSSAPSITSIPFCSDLIDNPERFHVLDTFGSELRKCDWADRKENGISRCALETVRENCPITCNVPCASQIPSTSPSISASTKPTAPSPSFTPSTMTSPISAAIPFCDDLSDSTADFYVGSLEHNNTMNCNQSNLTKLHCNIDVLKTNCPVFCEVLCYNETESPSSSPSSGYPSVAPFSENIGIAQSNEGLETNESSFYIKVAAIIVAGLAAVAVIILYGFLGGRKNPRIASPTAITGKLEYNDDEEQTIGSPSMNDLACVYTPKSKVPFVSSPSFVCADPKNLGLNYSTKDVHRCANFPCEICQRRKNLTFVTVKKTDKLERLADDLRGKSSSDQDSDSLEPFSSFSSTSSEEDESDEEDNSENRFRPPKR